MVTMKELKNEYKQVFLSYIDARKKNDVTTMKSCSEHLVRIADMMERIK